MVPKVPRIPAVAASLAVVLAVQCLAINPGMHTIISRESGQSLSVDLSNATENRANVVQWTDDLVPHRIWRVEHVGNNEYKIINMRRDKALIVDRREKDVDGGGANQFSYEKNSSHPRRRIEWLEGEDYRIINVHSGRCLDLGDYSPINGANIQYIRFYAWYPDSASSTRPFGSACLSIDQANRTNSFTYSVTLGYGSDDSVATRISNGGRVHTFLLDRMYLVGISTDLDRSRASSRTCFLKASRPTRSSGSPSPSTSASCIRGTRLSGRATSPFTRT